MEHFKIPTKPI